MKRSLLMMAALAFTTLHATAATNYLVEAKILSIDAKEKMTLQADEMVAYTNGDWRMLVKPGASADSIIAKLERQKGVDVLSAPKLVTLEAQEATISVGQSLRYLVPLSNDLYRAVQLSDDKSPGVHLSVTVTRSVVASNAVKLDLKLRSNLIAEMTDLPGFPGHKLGEPVISSRSIETVVSAPLDAWIIVGGNKVEQIEEKKSEMLMVVLRVSTRTLEAETDQGKEDFRPVPIAK